MLRCVTVVYMWCAVASEWSCTAATPDGQTSPAPRPNHQKRNARARRWVRQSRMRKEENHGTIWRLCGWTNEQIRKMTDNGCDAAMRAQGQLEVLLIDSSCRYLPLLQSWWWLLLLLLLQRQSQRLVLVWLCGRPFSRVAVASPPVAPPPRPAWRLPAWRARPVGRGRRDRRCCGACAPPVCAAARPDAAAGSATGREKKIRRC